jgi:hypothetical protein
VTERQILQDAISVCRINHGAFAETAAALGVFALQQVALASVTAQDFAGAGNLEPLGHGLLRFDAFGTSHKFLFNYKRARTICEGGRRGKRDFSILSCPAQTL